MNKITEELKKVGTFFIATVEGDQPRVRPFGAVAEFEGKTYICTNNTKPCYAQMLANPKTEISAMYPDGAWLRISGELVRDDRDEATAVRAPARRRCARRRRRRARRGGRRRGSRGRRRSRRRRP